VVVRKHDIRNDEQPENTFEILKLEQLLGFVGLFDFVGNELLQCILQEVGIIFVFCPVKFSHYRV
jgi:hypothetical protein